MKNIKIILLVLIIIVIIISVMLIYLLNINKLKALPDDSIPQDTVVEISSKVQKEVNDYKFFAIDDIVNNFLWYINNNEQEAIKAILDEEYSNTYNMQELVSNVNKFYMQSIYKQDSMNMSIYYINGKLDKKHKTNEKKLEDRYFKVYVNNEESIFSILPLQEQEYEQAINSDSTEIEKKEIIANKYNMYQENILTNEELANKYIEDFEVKIKYDLQSAYTLLDEKCRIEKFNNNFNEFEKYINSNKNKFTNIQLKDCNSQIYEDYIEYSIIDMNNYNYKIKRKNAMDYTIEL